MSGTQAPEGLPAWEDLPDFGLYMDQLLTCVERCYPGALTAGMINSYVKVGIVARPVGKKYSRLALAQLLMVTYLKPATPLDSLRRLLNPPDPELFAGVYGHFRELTRALAGEADDGDLSALDCAIHAASYQDRCRRLLGPEPVPEEKDKHKPAPRGRYAQAPENS